MIEFLYSIDVNILRFCNQTLSNHPFDVFFVFITNVKHWMPVYIAAVLGLLIWGAKKGRWASFCALLMITATDNIGYRLLKETICRPRPYKVLQGILLPGGESGTFSFPSNHALNNFALAMFFSLLYPKFKYVFFTIAVLVAFSRVYIGVHYPSDILGGAVLGLGFGYVFALLHRYLNNKNWQVKSAK